MFQSFDLAALGVMKVLLIFVYAYSTYRLTGVVFERLLLKWRTPAYLMVKPLDAEKGSRYFTHLELLLRSTTPRFNRHTVNQFLAKSMTLFAIVYSILLMGYAGDRFSLQLHFLWNFDAFRYATILAFLPYCWLRVRLYVLRYENGYALMSFVEKLLLKYRAAHHEADLYQTLYELGDELEGPMKRTASSMVSVLQLEGKMAIKEAVELFTYQVPGSWGRQLGVMFIKAAKENLNIEKALQKIHSDMTTFGQIVESEKSDASETVIMGLFPLFCVPLALYGLSLVIDVSMLKILLDEPRALLALILCVIAIFVGILTSIVLSKPKIEV
ncbi:hypothetical protein ABEW34_21625 [Paenibacillus algorifonticola]|uniref:hypothetical protein n=1 Tax=Paenibacillus algorifonticola TaxID=684063 RepID=UPI003D27E0DC